MKTLFKRLAMLLFVSALVLGCGKDNKTATEVPVVTTPKPDTDPLNPGVPDTLPQNIDEFIAAVRGGRFQNPRSSTSIFDYAKSQTNRDRSFFSFNWSFCFFGSCDSNLPQAEIMTRSMIDSNSVERESGDNEFSNNLSTLRDQLVSLLDQAKRRSRNPSAYYPGQYFYTQIRPGAVMVEKSGNFYVIDLNAPLAANPIFKYNGSNGEVYDLIGEF